MLRRVQIRGYKSLRDVEVRFAGPLTVVMGPNASGKSNLLDALALLARLALSPSLEEGFRDHRGRIVEAFTFQPGGLREALRQDALACAFEVDVELAEAAVAATEEEIAHRRAVFEEAKPERAAKVVERHLRYALAVEYRPSEKALRVTDESLVALKRTGEVKEARTPFLSRVTSGAHEAIGLRLEGQPARPAEFEIGGAATVVSRPHYAPHYPHVEAFKRELAGWRFHHLEPRAMRGDNDLKVVSTPGRAGEELAAFYDTLKARDRARFDALQRDLAALLPGVERVDVERSDDGFLRLLVQEGGTEFSARLMSEGTLRLVGLLALLQPVAPTTVVGLEEPDASVHPRRARALVRLLESAVERGGFQLIANTHSPLLASGVPAESLVVCRRGPEGTTFRPFGASGPLFKPVEIEEALADDASPAADFMARLVRGDFGG
jgi:predicted ATPase